MPGILYVVATPIGNLEDVTLRALRILREVSLVAAEDTRRTSKLLQHYSISTPTTSLHAHNEHSKARRLIEALTGGQSVALVSDAGTPAVSDPGARLVAAAHRTGITVQPVPGASAVTAVISASGIESEGFTFVGFPPNRSKPRMTWLNGLADHRFPLVMYEAPHRILATLSAIHEAFGTRTVAVGRELTKLHESLVVRPIDEWIREPPPPVGEFVLVIWPQARGTGEEAQAADRATLAREFWVLTNNDAVGRREGLRRVAEKFGVSAREVFAAVDEHPKSGE
jgi:16S rRNA (cytidine1402-2'-O)-methyltransferase